jgi:hypothetical protein
MFEVLSFRFEEGTRRQQQRWNDAAGDEGSVRVYCWRDLAVGRASPDRA